MPREVEAKIRVDSLEPLRTRLDELGAVNEGECLERNWVLDDDRESLRTSGRLLRVRTMGGPSGLLTVKRRVEGGEFKTREEIESMVDSAEDLLRQLEVVGFQVKWVYEKRRQTWLWRDCVLALDELPEIGCYIEIEGAPDTIRAVAADLGLDTADHIHDNYLELWVRHLREQNEAPRHMVFSRGATRVRRLSRPASPPTAEGVEE